MAIVLVGKWQQRLKPLILPALVGLLLLYTGDQLLTGERGIVTWRVMKTQLLALKAENQGLQDDIDRLNHHIDRMRGITVAGKATGKADGDFVDELVRRELGYMMPGEKMILRRDFGL